jgi:hypothetical protein
MGSHSDDGFQLPVAPFLNWRDMSTLRNAYKVYEEEQLARIMVNKYRKEKGNTRIIV